MHLSELHVSTDSTEKLCSRLSHPELLKEGKTNQTKIKSNQTIKKTNKKESLGKAADSKDARQLLYL